MILLLLTLAACDSEPPTASDPHAIQTDEPGVVVLKLFTADGCTVYRFVNADKYRYFTRCDVGAVETQQGDDCHTETYVVMAGKTPVTHVRTVCEDGGSIPTVAE